MHPVCPLQGIHKLECEISERQGHAMSEERLENIETKIAYQEAMIEELNKTIYQHQQKLDQFEATCRSLAGHIASLAESVNENTPVQNERPPHY